MINNGVAIRTWEGRVVRKVKRKNQVELSLKVDDVERTQTLIVKKFNNATDHTSDDIVSVQHPTCLQLQAFVRATVVENQSSLKEEDGRTWIVQKLELLECPADPLAVKAILKESSLWLTLQPYHKDHVRERSEEEEDLSSPNHALTKRLVMRLQHRKPVQPRRRPPHISAKLIQSLEVLEDQVDLVDISTSGLEDFTSSSALTSFGLNLPKTEDDRVLVSARHKLTRQEYLESKKHPQVAWFLQRLKKFPRVRHILDVGGGRGDLAIALAIGLGEDVRVTVVDINDSSLQAGRDFADQCGVGGRMDWVCDDFNTYAAREQNTDIDMIVALHACGNLSDLALSFAVSHHASFVICPCCYSKMENKSTASKLAEISERPDLSRRGMHVINSERYWNLMERGSHQIILEEYSRSWSSRNMVMIGWPKVQ